jgi:UDP-N-acetylmuramoylalanine--D-glutamate ligase
MDLAILGYGSSGKAAEKLAQKLNFNIHVFDDNIACFRKADKLQGIKPDLIVASPGLPESSEIMRQALKTKAPIISELEFGFEHCKAPAIAVTGSNGKTTTIELLAHILNNLDKKAVPCGNIGTPISEAALESPDADFFIVEVSSFQLEKCDKFSPSSSALLNISSDHLDHHKNFENYANAKLKIFKNVKKNKRVTSIALKNSAGNNAITFSSEKRNADFYFYDNFIFFREKAIVDLSQTKLKGAHNAENLMAAMALIYAELGLEALLGEAFKDAVSSFSTGAHRQELFAEKNGIKYFNDSKATNPASVTAALNALAEHKNACLILGGLDKDMDFSILLEAADKIKTASITGECAKKIHSELRNSIPCKVFENFDDAVFDACNNAKNGDIVILSPACASMDMFKNYIERGEKFKRLINEALKRDPL